MRSMQPDSRSAIYPPPPRSPRIRRRHIVPAAAFALQTTALANCMNNKGAWTMMNGGEGVQGARDSSKTVEKGKWF